MTQYRHIEGGVFLDSGNKLATHEYLTRTAEALRNDASKLERMALHFAETGEDVQYEGAFIDIAIEQRSQDD